MLSQSGYQLRISESRTCRRLRDVHTFQERAPDQLAIAVEKLDELDELDELIAQQCTSAQPGYLMRGPPSVWQECRWSNGPG